MFSGVELVSDNMNYSEKYVLPSQFFDFSINRWCEERYDTEDMWRQFNPYEKQKNIYLVSKYQMERREGEEREWELNMLLDKVVNGETKA